MQPIGVVAPVILGIICVFLLIYMYNKLKVTFNLLSYYLRNENGNLSLKIKYLSSKVPKKFLLYTDVDGLISIITPSEKKGEVTFILGKFRNITYPCKYLLKVEFESEVYTYEFTFKTSKPLVELLEVSTTSSPIGLIVRELIFKIINDSDYPIYITDENFKIYLNDREVSKDLGDKYLVVDPHKFIITRVVTNILVNYKELSKNNVITIKCLDQELKHVIPDIKVELKIINIDYVKDNIKTIELMISNSWIYSINTYWIDVIVNDKLVKGNYIIEPSIIGSGESRKVILKFKPFIKNHSIKLILGNEEIHVKV
ncbi:MAG: hypothetical protein B6V02_04065 [Thermoprotei archaeon ex4572_64]|nr:MAG: hypothetical protein B6V02_04065 [Thermoprotei archaeon ex4572_64]